MRRFIAAVSIALIAPTAWAEGAPPAPRDGASHAVPLYGELIAGYDAPEDPYAAGHRGVDIAAPAGAAVHASADGSVAFVGVVAGNRTVSIDHLDGVRTSYSYLATTTITRGASVTRGDVVGTVGDGHPSGHETPHVHLSARLDGIYFDPVELYVGSSWADLIRLIG